MKKTILLTLSLFVVAVINLNAQCFNDGSQGVHYVQKGETLYKIARNNDVSVAELCAMNGISANSPLSICQKLKVRDVVVNTVKESNIPKTYSIERPQPAMIKSPGAVFTPRATNTVKNINLSYASRLSQSKGTHIAEVGETLADIAKYYGYTTDRLAEMNSFNKSMRIEEGMLIIVNDCFFQEGLGNTTPKSYSAEPVIKITNPEPAVTTKSVEPEVITIQPEPSIAKKSEPITQPQPTVATSKPTPNKPAPTMNMYMQSEEMEMVDEINLVRSNPTAYVKHIEDYIENKIKKGLGFASEAVARELIAELKETPSLSILKPTKCIYEAATKHGQDRLKAGSTDHQGTDGSWPWDRVTSSCPDMTDGNENLVGGPSSIREAVIILLIDDGIPNRGHRKTMLQADWEYVACFKIGQVGSMPNNWVQKYGK